MRVKLLYVVAAAAAAFTGANAVAQSSASATGHRSAGLGTEWPNAPDVSADSRFHVYRFDKAGVRYIQVNDANGHVRMAVATDGQNYMVLPVGSSPVSVLPPATSANAAPGVYQDGQTIVTATDSGFAVQSGCTDPLSCNRANQDPTQH